MLLACLPFGPWVTSKLTFWPSFSVLKPCMLIAEKCANRSSPPPSGVMKPNPFASLNHFTVPVAIFYCSLQIKRERDRVPCQCFDHKEITAEVPLRGGTTSRAFCAWDKTLRALYLNVCQSASARIIGNICGVRAATVCHR